MSRRKTLMTWLMTAALVLFLLQLGIAHSMVSSRSADPKPTQEQEIPPSGAETR